MPDESIPQQLDAAIAARFDESIADLTRLVNEPSVAAQNLGIEDCAALVADLLVDLDFETDIMPTAGSPVVVAEAAGRTDKTLIFYLHYDVQPPEPIDLWESPPFELTRRGDKLYGRGVSDDKGNIIARLAAVRAVKDVLGELPCNIKFCIEGEEEIGSVHLPEFVAANTDRLAADACIWEFGGVDMDGAPLQVLGMRGICYVELSVQTAQVDTHSGLTGSIAHNAAWRLTWALSTLKDRDERIRIPGFYDDVQPASQRDMEMLRALPADRLDRYKALFGIDEWLYPQVERVELERLAVFEPTCTICGLTSGYQGPGSKTVLPAQASAKVDFRLVPDQDPDDIRAKLRAHLDAEGFDDITITYLGGEPPGRTDPDHPFIALVNRAAEAVYSQPPHVYPMIGGSGPNHAFLHHLNVPIAVSGVGYPGGNIHAPNEHILVQRFEQGIQHAARIIVDFAAM